MNVGSNEGADVGVTKPEVDKWGKLDAQKLRFSGVEQMEGLESGFWTRDGIDDLFFLLVKRVLTIGRDGVRGVGLWGDGFGDNIILMIWFKIAWLWPDNMTETDVLSGTGPMLGNSSGTVGEDASKVSSETFPETGDKVDVEIISKFVFKVDNGTSPETPVLLGGVNEPQDKLDGNTLGKPNPEPNEGVQGLESWGVVGSFKTEETALSSNLGVKSEIGGIEVNLEPINLVLPVFLSNVLVGTKDEHSGI